MTQPRRGPRPRFTEVVQVGIEPVTRERIETLVERAPSRHPSFAQALREAIDTGLPVLERNIEDSEQRAQDISGRVEPEQAEAVAV